MLFYQMQDIAHTKNESENHIQLNLKMGIVLKYFPSHSLSNSSEKFFSCCMLYWSSWNIFKSYNCIVGGNFSFKFEDYLQLKRPNCDTVAWVEAFQSKTVRFGKYHILKGSEPSPQTEMKLILTLALKMTPDTLLSIFHIYIKIPVFQLV